jgi:hypothetical protein
MPLRFWPLLLLSFLLPTGALALSSPLPPPTGEVLLTISGDIDQTNVGEEAHFDRDMLRPLPSRTIETRTPWHSDKGRFEGPLFHELLSAVGANGKRVRVRALNGYEAEIPVSELREHEVILAMKRNNEPMAIRDFGPLFVVYPFDDHPELLTETIRFRSVWQVSHIHVP